MKTNFQKTDSAYQTAPVDYVPNFDYPDDNAGTISFFNN